MQEMFIPVVKKKDDEKCECVKSLGVPVSEEMYHTFLLKAGAQICSFFETMLWAKRKGVVVCILETWELLYVACFGGFPIAVRWKGVWLYRVCSNIWCGSIDDQKRAMDFLCADWCKYLLLSWVFW